MARRIKSLHTWSTSLDILQLFVIWVNFFTRIQTWIALFRSERDSHLVHPAAWQSAAIVIIIHNLKLHLILRPKFEVHFGLGAGCSTCWNVSFVPRYNNNNNNTCFVEWVCVRMYLWNLDLNYNFAHSHITPTPPPSTLTSLSALLSSNFEPYVSFYSQSAIYIL